MFILYTLPLVVYQEAFKKKKKSHYLSERDFEVFLTQFEGLRTEGVTAVQTIMPSYGSSAAQINTGSSRRHWAIFVRISF